MLSVFENDMYRDDLCVNIQGMRKFFFKDFIYFQREGKGEREGEKHQCVLASRSLPTGDLALNPGMCPDLELNQ